MKTMKFKHFDFHPVIGFGYWKERYEVPFKGYSHNIIFLFFVIQFGQLEVKGAESFNKNELRHLAINYAAYCLRGYKGTFEKWFDGLRGNWEAIANRENVEK